MIPAIVAFVLTTALVLLPLQIKIVDWQYDPTQYPSAVTWAGCKARVVTSDQHSPIESYYSPSEYRLYVGTREDGDIPYYAGLFILFHEVGHCLQDQDGTLDYNYHVKIKDIELDADRRATDLLCGLGLDGRRINHDTFVWAYETFGYEGDRDHGTLAERIGQGQLARACDKRPGD